MVFRLERAAEDRIMATEEAPPRSSLATGDPLGQSGTVEARKIGQQSQRLGARLTRSVLLSEHRVTTGTEKDIAVFRIHPKDLQARNATYGVGYQASQDARADPVTEPGGSIGKNWYPSEIDPSGQNRPTCFHSLPLMIDLSMSSLTTNNVSSS